MWSIHPATLSKKLENEPHFLRLFSSYPNGWPHTIFTRLIGPDPNIAGYPEPLLRFKLKRRNPDWPLKSGFSQAISVSEEIRRKGSLHNGRFSSRTDAMTRMTPFSSPLLLGFDTMEKRWNGSQNPATVIRPTILNACAARRVPNVCASLWRWPVLPAKTSKS